MAARMKEGSMPNLPREPLSTLDHLTQRLLIEREARKTAERRSRVYESQVKKLRAKLAALAHLKPDHDGAAAE
jgi:hypothetical protein